MFSIGLWKLNPDGSEMKDANGNSIPTYGVSAAFTLLVRLLVLESKHVKAAARPAKFCLSFFQILFASLNWFLICPSIVSFLLADFAGPC